MSEPGLRSRHDYSRRQAVRKLVLKCCTALYESDTVQFWLGVSPNKDTHRYRVPF
jgi:hypothetical protein